jgi:hypothetical protein
VKNLSEYRISAAFSAMCCGKKKSASEREDFSIRDWEGVAAIRAANPRWDLGLPDGPRSMMQMGEIDGLYRRGI